MDVRKTGRFIAEKRKAKNMSQKELVEYLHITDKAVSKWERGGLRYNSDKRLRKPYK